MSGFSYDRSRPVIVRIERVTNLAPSEIAITISESLREKDIAVDMRTGVKNPSKDIFKIVQVMAEHVKTLCGEQKEPTLCYSISAVVASIRPENQDPIEVPISLIVSKSTVSNAAVTVGIAKHERDRLPEGIHESLTEQCRLAMKQVIGGVRKEDPTAVQYNERVTYALCEILHKIISWAEEDSSSNRTVH